MLPRWKKRIVYLYKYACCTPGANTPAWEVGKAFNDSSSTNSKNRLISAPSKNCASSTTLSFNNWRARWRTVAAPGRRTKERKNDGRRTKEQRKNGRRTEEHRSITLSHQVPSSTMQWARQHGRNIFIFEILKFWDGSTVTTMGNNNNNNNSNSNSNNNVNAWYLPSLSNNAVTTTKNEGTVNMLVICQQQRSMDKQQGQEGQEKEAWSMNHCRKKKHGRWIRVNKSGSTEKNAQQTKRMMPNKQVFTWPNISWYNNVTGEAPSSWSWISYRILSHADRMSVSRRLRVSTKRATAFERPFRLMASCSWCNFFKNDFFDKWWLT